MSSFKNIEKSPSENATYAVYKKLTAQDVVSTWYVAKKSFTILGNELSSYNIVSLLFDRDVTSAPPPPIPSRTPSPTPTPSTTPTP